MAETNIARPFICVSYIGASVPAEETYESTISGTVESVTTVAQLTPTSNVSYIDSTPKELEATIALPATSVSYIDDVTPKITPKKLESSIASPFICVSYIGASVPAEETYESTISGTVESVTTVAQLTPTSNVSYIDSTPKELETNIALPYVCVSYVPSSVLDVTVNVDLSRNLSNVVTVNYDTARNVTTAQTVNADTARNIVATTALTADTCRNVVKTVTSDVDTQRNVATAVGLNADTKRNIAKTSTVKADTKRNVAAAVALNADTARNVVKTLTIDVDLAREISGAIPATVTVDTARNIVTTTNLNVDTARNIINTTELNADTYRNVQKTIEFDVDLARIILGTVPFTLDIDICRNVTSSQTINVDTARNVVTATELNADTCRNVQKTITVDVDLAREIAGLLPITVDVDTSREVVKTVTVDADTKRIIAIQYIGDTWRYENYGDADLLAVAGTTVANLEKTQAVYKTAFYTTAARSNYFGLPAVDEVWIKFDVIFREKYQSLFVGSLDNDKNTLVRLNCTGVSNDYARIIFALSNNVASDTTNQFTVNTLYKVVVHLKSGTTEGKIDLFVNDEHNLAYTGNVNNGNNFASIYIESGYYNSIGSYPYVSNVIISNAQVDLNENVKVPLEVVCDCRRDAVIVLGEYQVTADLLRNVCLRQTLINDTLRNVQKTIELANDTAITLLYSVNLDVDLVRTLPHKVILSPVAEFGGEPDTSNDFDAKIQNFEIRLSEQSLTDELVFSTVKPIQMLEQVTGQYLDYKFDVRVETKKTRGILRTCTCCSDIDEILYKQIEYAVPENERWHFNEVAPNPTVPNVDIPNLDINFFYPYPHDPYAGLYLQPSQVQDEENATEKYGSASSHITTIAEILGKQPVLRFDDFISTVDITAGGTTYNDLIRSIFGWTSRIPTMMINCYLRDDKLFVVQRNCEENEIDLTNSGAEIVSHDEELVRTIWGNSTWARTETREIKGRTWTTADFHLPIQSVILGAGTQITYCDSSVDTNKTGLIKKAETEENGIKTVTEYEYDEYSGGRPLLSKETTTVYEQEETGDWIEIDRRVTRREYTHNGAGQVYSHSVSEDDDGNVTYVGNSVNQSPADDRLTPYDLYNFGNEHPEESSWREKDRQLQRTLYGLTNFDTSFPVHGDDTLAAITDAIKWLNRKTQDTITLNLYDYPHVIDFNDRIILNGNVYYLKSNTAIKTPRIVNKQTLSLVRWY